MAEAATQGTNLLIWRNFQHLAQGHFDVQLGDPEIEPPTYQLLDALSHSLPPTVTTKSDAVHTEKTVAYNKKGLWFTSSVAVLFVWNRSEWLVGHRTSTEAARSKKIIYYVHT